MMAAVFKTIANTITVDANDAPMQAKQSILHDTFHEGKLFRIKAIFIALQRAFSKSEIPLNPLRKSLFHKINPSTTSLFQQEIL